jgi:hypothetical protein
VATHEIKIGGRNVAQVNHAQAYDEPLPGNLV